MASLAKSYNVLKYNVQDVIIYMHKKWDFYRLQNVLQCSYSYSRAECTLYCKTVVLSIINLTVDITHCCVHKLKLIR